MVNLLEEQADIEVASYIGFDNAEAAQVSGYAVLDYFGGPGVLGSGEQVEVEEGAYLDLDWWESVYEGVDLTGVTGRGVIIECIAGTYFSQARVDGFSSVVDRAPWI